MRRILAASAFVVALLACTAVPAGAHTSGNWSGNLILTPSTSVSASWIEPAIPATQNETAADTWIGIGGWSNFYLIQTGVVAIGENGTTYDQAWAYLYSSTGSSWPILNPGNVNAGDHLSAAITLESPGRWNIALADSTVGWSVSVTVAYPEQASTAEWVEEAPGIPQLPLADYGAVTFTTMRVDGAPPRYLDPVNMTPTQPHVASYPLTYVTDSGTTTDLYGSQCVYKGHLDATTMPLGQVCAVTLPSGHVLLAKRVAPGVVNYGRLGSVWR